jgi:hypothetical protein
MKFDSTFVSNETYCEFRNAESRFSQLLYQGQTLVVQKLTESKFGISKFGIPIEIWSLMSAGIGCTENGKQASTHPRRSSMNTAHPREGLGSADGVASGPLQRYAGCRGVWPPL